MHFLVTCARLPIISQVSAKWFISIKRNNTFSKVTRAPSLLTFTYNPPLSICMLCVRVFSQSVGICTTGRPCTSGGQRRVLDPLELEFLQIIVSHNVGAGDRTWVFNKNRKSS